MSPLLHTLPTRLAGAAENMAIDFMLLQRYPEASEPRFRHYGWHRPALTFGYSQKIEFIRAQGLIGDEPVELCRRFTGGGLVDHRDDWTYAVVLPRGHDLEKARAIDTYRIVHEALAEALRAQGQSANTKKPGSTCDSPAAEAALAGICFRKAECFDVINPTDGSKIAGAAQKRNKHGLVLQGSLWRPAAPNVGDWEAFQESFVAKLAAAFGASPTPAPWPDWNEDEVNHLTETYASSDWMEQR